jgi:translation elongation factor EF-G
MSNVRSKLVREYPNIDPETRQTILSGTQEMFLEIVLDRLIHQFDVSVNVSKPIDYQGQ